ncbi:MAG TPA: sulfatase [Chthoniobacteraceae bacterium]|jgi:arylsulfatase A-like enzyme|nr:sulfatase [Chthoniobacteraceae bacterium]
MSSAPPNILYVVCHDTGRELGCYGRRIRTPRLDAFAAEGIRLSNMFCSSPACAPSRSCTYSGMPAHLNGQMGVSPSGCALAAHIPTVVDYLNLGGYETAHIGFQHERYRAIENRYRVEKGAGNLSLAENGVDAAISYLKSRKPTDKPFYLNVATMENHCRMWQNQCDNRRAFYGSTPPEEIDFPEWVPDDPLLRVEFGNFQACIRYFDSQMGRLLDAIDQLGYRENTLVIICTDHGPSGIRAKGTLYDHGTEIFFLARLPGRIPSGAISDALLQNMDCAPTLLEAAGLPIPGNMHGRSFWPLLNGRDYLPHDCIFMERNYHGEDAQDLMRAVRSRDFLYIRNFSPGATWAWTRDECPPLIPTYKHWFTDMWPPETQLRPREELYSVQGDPHQFRNIASLPAFQWARRDLAAKLEDFMRRTGDPALFGPVYSVATLEKAAGRNVIYREEHPPEYPPELISAEPAPR